MPIATPDGPNGANNPLYGVMQSIMARYHADMEAQINHTLADLAGRWQGVRASLAETITRLERQMQAAVDAGDSITYTWLSQQARLLDLKAAVAGDIAQYAAGARQIIGEGQTSAAETGLAAAQAKLDALTPPGVNYTWGVPPRSVLDQIAGATQPYSPLYALFEQMGPLAANNAAQALFQSVALGENPRAAARRLVWATDMSARRAEVIARTEIHRAWRQAQFANYRANSDVVQQWMWSADFASERTCGACIALDGSLHPLDEELADHVCGRCDAIPVTRPWSEVLAGTGIPDDELAALDNGDASTWMSRRESGADWLARQPVDTQNRVLGPAKAEAWRQGAISLRDIAGISHDPTWGRSIEERSLKSLGLDAQRWLAAARSNGTAATAMSREARKALSEWEQQRAAAIPAGMGEQVGQDGLTLASALDDAESNIRNLPHEESYAIGPDGQLLFHQAGQSDEIRLTREQVEVLQATPGAVLTHNHPGGSTFSAQDFRAFAGSGVAEMRVVTPDYTYIFRPPATGWGKSTAQDVENWLARYRSYADQNIDTLRPLLKAGELGDMTPMQVVAEAQSRAWQKLADEVGFNYEAIQVEGVGAPAETSPVWQDIANKLARGEDVTAPALDVPTEMSMEANAALSRLMNEAINDPSFDVGGNFRQIASDLAPELTPQLSHVDEILDAMYPEAAAEGMSVVTDIEQEYAAAVARGEVDAAAVSLDEYKTQALIRHLFYAYHQYAGGSSSISPIQVALQEAAQAEFGLTSATARYTSAELAAAQAAFGDAMPDLQAVLRGVYSNTQQWFADQGITEVTLYRGMRVSDPALFSGVNFNGQLENATVALQPISAYTTDLNGTAAVYTTMNGGAEYSILVQTTVPASDILSTPFTGMGAMYQSEMVVLGGDYASQVVGIQGEMDSEELTALLTTQFGAQ